MRRLRDERGLALVEAPLCLVVVLLLLMGVITITQVIWTHLDLAEAARDTVRYATRVEYDPAAGSSSRHRTAVEVEAWARDVASETCDIETCTVTFEVCHGDCADDEDPPATETQDDLPPSLETLRTGDQVIVTISKKVSNPLYVTAAGITNAMARMLHAGQPFDPKGLPIKAEAQTYVE